MLRCFFVASIKVMVPNQCLTQDCKFSSYSLFWKIFQKNQRQQRGSQWEHHAHRWQLLRIAGRLPSRLNLPGALGSPGQRDPTRHVARLRRLGVAKILGDNSYWKEYCCHFQNGVQNKAESGKKNFFWFVLVYTVYDFGGRLIHWINILT